MERRPDSSLYFAQERTIFEDFNASFCPLGLGTDEKGGKP